MPYGPLLIVIIFLLCKPKSLGYKITNLFGNIMDYKLKGEQAMASSYENANNNELSY